MKNLLTTSLFVTTIALSGCNDSDDKSPKDSSNPSPLTLQTYTPGEDAVFAVASTLISGKKDAILVDAQFQNQYAKDVVNLIKKSGKNLKYIYISHSDPDYYFGTNEILKAFPNAKVVSTAQTAYLIQASKEDKLSIWQPQLAKGDAPEKIIIPEALNSGYMELDGQKIQVQLDPEDSTHSFLWIPSLKTALGGISVAYGEHLWMADTNGVQGIDLWKKQIDKILSLNPEKVIPGHYVKSDFSPKPLDWIKGYLTNFKTAVTENQSSEGIFGYMKAKYPDLESSEEVLKMSAQVFAKETDWKVASPYPPIGQKIQVDFTSLEFDLDVKDHQNLTFTGAGGADGPDLSEAVKYTPVEIAKNIFMFYWHEDKSGDNVVHIQDYNRDIVYTNIAGNDGTIHLKGKILGVKGVIKDIGLQQVLNKPFFAIGQTLALNINGQTRRLEFKDQSLLNITSGQNTSANIEYLATQVGPEQFMVYWTDDATKENVVLIIDQKQKIIYQNIAMPDGKFNHHRGTFSLLPK